MFLINNVYAQYGELMLFILWQRKMLENLSHMHNVYVVECLIYSTSTVTVNCVSETVTDVYIYKMFSDLRLRRSAITQTPLHIFLERPRRLVVYSIASTTPLGKIQILRVPNLTN